MIKKINIIADKNNKAQKIKKILINKINFIKNNQPNLNIVIGGDGFMLQTLKKIKTHRIFFMVLILEIMVF